MNMGASIMNCGTLIPLLNMGFTGNHNSPQAHVVYFELCSERNEMVLQFVDSLQISFNH